MIILLDLATIISTFTGMLIVLFRWKKQTSPILKCVIASMFLLLFIYASFMFLKWAGIETDSEDLENLSGAMLPIFWIILLAAIREQAHSSEIRTREERMSLVLEGASLGTWDWNIRTGAVVFNERWATMLGYDLGEIEPNVKIWETLIHPDDFAEANNLLNLHLSGETTSYETEHRMRSKNGDWVWVLDKGKVVERDEMGNAVRAAGTHLNITERKQMQEELQLTNEEYLAANEELSESIKRIQEINVLLEESKEKAEQSDRLKTAFLANLSHEIRTPMNGILGFSDLLRNQNTPPETQDKYLDLIQRSGKRMLALINDLVDISKIEANQVEINTRETEIIGLLKRVHNLFLISAWEKKIALNLNIGNTQNIVVNLDDMKLEQILSNLLSNAIKFTHTGEVEIGFRPDGDRLKFWVKDTGIGIPEEKIPIIFDRFRQIDDRAFKADEGCGLGLSISKAFIELMHGEISIESELQKGSTFSISFPYSNPTAATKLVEENGSDTNIPEAISILIAEDDEISMLLLYEILRDQKITIVRAHDGEEALKIFKQNHSFSAILLDIKMPKINGLDVAKEIRKVNKTIPIIAQTAYVSTDEKDEIMNAGCDYIISKPIMRKDLMHLLQSVIK